MIVYTSSSQQQQDRCLQTHIKSKYAGYKLKKKKPKDYEDQHKAFGKTTVIWYLPIFNIYF